MKVLIACCARQKELIFKEFLESVRNLDVSGVAVSYGFVFHNWPEGEKLVNEANLPGPLLSAHHTSQNQYVANETTHHWNNALINDMILMKNAILQTCITQGFDYVFIVDSDLYLHPHTLQVLLSRKKDIISAAFWTKWNPDQPEMPNAWDFDHYSFHEHSLELWRQPGVHQVGGTGACILISTDAIKQGVKFDSVPNVSWWGEDRYFQLHASTRGISMWMDTTCPIYHIYRESELVGLQRFKANLPQLPKSNIRTKPSPKLSAMMIVSNEANRYLREVLDHLQETVDDIAIVDDHSTDGTVQICKQYSKARVLELPASFFQVESTLRKSAWDWTLDGNPDWVLAIDADEIIEDPTVVRRLIHQDTVDVWMMRRFDMWNETHYREDPLWTAHFSPIAMLLRVFPEFPYRWDGRDHHSFRLPQNRDRFVTANTDLRVKHLGWAKEADRIAKYERYQKHDPEGKWGSVAQYNSILDPNPNLIPW